MTFHPLQRDFVRSLFYDDPAGSLAHGHIFMNAPDISSDRLDPEIGYWHCDIAHHEELTWSEKVYELFGLPTGALVRREEAVTRYSELSRSVLERVRKYALSRKYGFILDAEICPVRKNRRWIRILAIPIVKSGRVVGLHGLKRAL